MEEGLLKLLPVDNQFFAGGLGLGAMGIGMSFLRKASTTFSMLARRHLLMTLEVTSKDATYPWVLQWLNAHGRRTQVRSTCSAESARCAMPVTLDSLLVSCERVAAS